MDSSRKSNKIREIVRLQQILKKWKKLANANKSSIADGAATASSSAASGGGSGNKGVKFLKKTLSFTENTSSFSNVDVVPKGYLAVCVGKELKRFVIPMAYLGHQAFAILLREAEEEFGFQQEGVLKIPCEVALFEKILKVMDEKRPLDVLDFVSFDHKDNVISSCYSPDHCELSTPSHHPQMCR